jgi:hypothetical protein
MRHQIIVEKLSELYKTDVCQGKGGFWIKNKGFMSLFKARQVTGISAPPRKLKPLQLPWGDYATIAMLNGRKF